jgi:peptidyl-prolyl cis-trans isomerase A (cyclophilin A)
MNKLLLLVMSFFLSLSALSINAGSTKAKPIELGSNIQPDNLFPVVELQTSAGKITLELDRLRAPITTNNFLYYVVNGEYNGTIFHRVEKGFVVQGGGYDENFREIKQQSAIYNESGNGLKNELFTIAMARENDPHSATSQFYFNMADNEGLDPGKTWGYAVFGVVSEGEDVLEFISNTATHTNPTINWENVPIKPIHLNKAILLSVE